MGNFVSLTQLGQEGNFVNILILPSCENFSNYRGLSLLYFLNSLINMSLHMNIIFFYESF